jgi:hypothetical protein
MRVVGLVVSGRAVGLASARPDDCAREVSGGDVNDREGSANVGTAYPRGVLLSEVVGLPELGRRGIVVEVGLRYRR